MAHRISDNDEGYLEGLRPTYFAEQIKYLTRHYEILSLNELVRCFEQHREIPANSVVLTFDDGFRNNLEHAVPVLAHHRVPATIFLVTGSVSSGKLPWSQLLGYLFQHTTVSTLQHSLIESTGLELTTVEKRKKAYLQVKLVMKRVSRIERERYLHQLSELLEVEPPLDRMLTWEQVRELQTKNIEFGAHTFSHPLLANLTRQEARWEMEKSRFDLERELSIQRPLFAFPAGSYNDELVHMAISLGFRSFFQRNRRLRINNLTSTTQYSLSRVGLPNAPAYVLEAELDGPLHAVRRLYRK
ncbi:polysaccharide deacetylase family protein [Acidobacteriota bacterium]